MRTGAPGLGAGLGQRVLDAEPGQPVGQVADRLVVVEVGLPDPALRARAAHDEDAVALRLDGEAGVVDRLRPQDDPGRLLRRLGRAVLGDQLGQRERQLAAGPPG